ncbi:MAG: type I secretion system permease/ATPase [Betaproteobacteria bacterium]|nr:type I secretion system permease/ATPase [Betaproteobacteria bacterium]
MASADIGSSTPLHAFASRFRPYFVSAAAFSLLLNLLLLVPALFMLQVFDRVLTSRSMETLVMLLVLSVGALMFMAYLDVIRSRLLTAAAVALEKLLGPRVLSEMIRRNATPGAGEALHGLRDVNSLRTFLTGPGILALFDSPWVPVYVLVIFLFHPLLGALALAGALVMLALAILNEKISRGPLEAMQLDSRKAGRFAEQGIANAEVARALGMVSSLARGWEILSRIGLQNQLQASRTASVLGSITRFMRQFLQVAMLAAGAWLVIDQQATPGVMIAGTILLSRALAPVEIAIAGWKGLVDARSAYGRLDAMLAAEPRDDAVTELPAPLGALAVDRAVFGFRGNERPVIRQISFSLDAGQALAIVGPSASGKSTLARLIVGLWKPAVGVVRLDGANITDWPRPRLGPYVGYLPQDVELFAGTVSQNIARMGEVDSAAVIEAAERAHVHDLILHLPQGYDTPIGEGGAFLSAGQRQRVALARALYGRPRLVVLDEPNSNLDGEGEAALIEALRQMKADGVTLAIVTHRSTLLAVVDRILVLREGAIERFGSPQEVLGPSRPRGPEGHPAMAAGQMQPKG